MGKATIPVPVRERIVQLYEQGRSTREIAACLGFCVAAGPSARLVFVDESGANTKMTRLYGRAPVGQRRLARPPHGPYQTRTRIAGVRLRGPCAPRVFEGAMDGAMFLAWVRQGLGPARQPEEGVLLDHLATHQVRGVRAAIAAGGAGGCICRPIPRTSIPSKTSGARSNRSCAACPRARATNCCTPWPAPAPRFQPPTATASFYTLHTLHDCWKRSSPPVSDCCSDSSSAPKGLNPVEVVDEELKWDKLLYAGRSLG